MPTMFIDSKVKKQKEDPHNLILPKEVIIKEVEEASETKEEEALVEEEDLSYVTIVINPKI
jgi:hypothetical protein